MRGVWINATIMGEIHDILIHQIKLLYIDPVVCAPFLLHSTHIMSLAQTLETHKKVQQADMSNTPVMSITVLFCVWLC